jgi:hypothetical protein
LLLLGCNYAIVGINHTLPTFQGYTPYYFCQVIYVLMWKWDTIFVAKLHEKVCLITLKEKNGNFS